MQESTPKLAPAHTESVDRVPFAVAAVVLAVAAGLLLLRSAPVPRRPAATSSPPAVVPLSDVRRGLFALDTTTHRIVRAADDSVFVPGAVTGFGTRWAGTSRGVERVDAAGVAAPWSGIPGGAESVVVAGHDVWATSWRNRTGIFRVDPANAGTTWLHLSGHLSGRLFSGAGSLWAPSRTSLLQIDPATGLVVASYPIQPDQPGHNADVMTFGAGSAWVVDEHSTELDVARPGVLYRIDPATRTIMARIPMPALNWYDEFELAYGGGLVWVADDHAGILRAVSPQTDAVVRIRQVGVIDSMAVGGRSVWLVGPAHGLTQLGLDGRPTWQSEVPGSPSTIALDGTRLWVSYRRGA